jgi:hypothetical protein
MITGNNFSTQDIHGYINFPRGTEVWVEQTDQMEKYLRCLKEKRMEEKQ